MYCFPALLSECCRGLREKRVVSSTLLICPHHPGPHPSHTCYGKFRSPLPFFLVVRAPQSSHYSRHLSNPPGFHSFLPVSPFIPVIKSSQLPPPSLSDLFPIHPTAFLGITVITFPLNYFCCLSRQPPHFLPHSLTTPASATLLKSFKYPLIACMIKFRVSTRTSLSPLSPAFPMSLTWSCPYSPAAASD